MKRSILLAAACLSLVLTGCASMGAQRSSQFDSDIDLGKVVAVNQWAETRGAIVMWMNYPQKPKNLNTSTQVN